VIPALAVAVWLHTGSIHI